MRVDMIKVQTQFFVYFGIYLKSQITLQLIEQNKDIKYVFLLNRVFKYFP